MKKINLVISLTMSFTFGYTQIVKEEYIRLTSMKDNLFNEDAFQKILTDSTILMYPTTEGDYIRLTSIEILLLDAFTNYDIKINPRKIYFINRVLQHESILTNIRNEFVLSLIHFCRGDSQKLLNMEQSKHKETKSLVNHLLLTQKILSTSFDKNEIVFSRQIDSIVSEISKLNSKSQHDVKFYTISHVIALGVKWHQAHPENFKEEFAKIISEEEHLIPFAYRARNVILSAPENKFIDEDINPIIFMFSNFEKLIPLDGKIIVR